MHDFHERSVSGCFKFCHSQKLIPFATTWLCETKVTIRFQKLRDGEQEQVSH